MIAICLSRTFRQKGSAVGRPSSPGLMPMPGPWFGQLTKAEPSFEDPAAITRSGGRFALNAMDTFVAATFGQYFGTATVAGTDVRATGSTYTPFGSAWSDESVVHATTPVGTLNERSSMSGAWVNGGIETVV